MASKSFAINVQPHEAVIGNDTLRFLPEVSGAAFATAYADLKAAQKRVTAAGDDYTTEDLIAVNGAMRSFLSDLMSDDESRGVFNASNYPDRILVQLIEWAAELYGGASGNDRGSSSGGS